MKTILLAVHPEHYFTPLLAHPLVQEDESLEDVIDACTDFFWGEAVQQQLQGLHTLCDQMDATILH